MENPMIYSALTAAAAAINSVGKNGVNSSQGWKFRSIDDVYNALNPALIAAGLTIVPRVMERDISTERVMQSNGIEKAGATTARLTMQYTVYAQDGSSIEAVTIGEGRDFGDKACNKAMAIAYKYMAFQLFCIPTEEMRRDDPDLYIVENGAEKPSNAPQPAVKENPAPAPETRQSAGKTPKKAAASVKETKEEPKPAQKAPSRLDELSRLAMLMHTNMAGVKGAWAGMQADGKIPNKATKDLTDEEFSAAISLMEQQFVQRG